MIAPVNIQIPASGVPHSTECDFSQLAVSSDRMTLLRHDYSSEQARNQLPAGPPASHRVSGVDFSSASEATCAILFEKYIPNYTTRPGDNYQIQIGTSLRGNVLYADFEIAGAIVEFHPPRLWRPGKPYGDFKSRSERREYRKQMKQAKPADRKFIKERAIENLGKQYGEMRRRILDETPAFKDKPLIVAINEGDLYDKVIKKYGIDVPTKADFLKEFAKIRSDVHKNYSLRSDKTSRRNKKAA